MKKQKTYIPKAADNCTEATLLSGKRYWWVFCNDGKYYVARLYSMVAADAERFATFKTAKDRLLEHLQCRVDVAKKELAMARDYLTPTKRPKIFQENK